MMNFALDSLNRFAGAVLELLVQPFYYIGILFVILQYRRQILLERKLFHVKLHSLLNETWRTLLWGIAVGFCASVVMAFAGASLLPDTVILLWIISFLLIMVRVRYLCIAYSIGILGVIHSALKLFPQFTASHEGEWWLQPFIGLHMPSLLALVALLHLAEALLIRWQGARSASPMFFQGKRGKLIGGYHLQGFWPVPLFLVVPLETDGGALPWAPLLGGDLWTSGGWTILALPVVIGFAEMTMTRLPSSKTRWSSGMMFIYSAAVLLLAIGAEIWPIVTIGASMLCIILHEMLIWHSSWQESQEAPLYVHDPRGLFILGIIPSSAAEEMGIQAGEVIHAVNGVKVKTKEQLHQALRLNSAFCKLDIINLEGQNKYLKRALFSGEHHQLGIILAPDQDAQYFVGLKQTHMVTYFRIKLSGLFQQSSKEV